MQGDCCKKSCQFVFRNNQDVNNETLRIHFLCQPIFKLRSHKMKNQIIFLHNCLSFHHTFAISLNVYLWGQNKRVGLWYIYIYSHNKIRLFTANIWQCMVLPRPFSKCWSWKIAKSNWAFIYHKFLSFPSKRMLLTVMNLNNSNIFIIILSLSLSLSLRGYSLFKLMQSYIVANHGR